jgi:hypothetical protein
MKFAWALPKLRRWFIACTAASGLVYSIGSAQDVGISDPAPNRPPIHLQSGHDADYLNPRGTAPLQWGPISARPRVLYRLTDSDGILRVPGEPTTTTINTLSPGLLVEIGRRWTADYSPTWTTYTQGAFEDTVEHAFSLAGNAAFTDGTVRFTQTYLLSDSPRIETGVQTKQESSGTSLNVNYGLSSRTRIELGVSQYLRWVESAPNSADWSTQGLYHYMFSERLDAGAGMTVGYTAVDPGVDMSYLRPQLRVGWKPTSKIGLDAHYGLERRKFKAEGYTNLNTPTYGISAFYMPFEQTMLSLAASRSVGVSLVGDQLNDNESVSLGLNQRLLGRLNFNASVARTYASYIDVGGSLETVRDDILDSYSLRLSTSFLRRGTIGLVYQRTRNDTNVAGYGFTSTEMGLEASYSY